MRIVELLLENRIDFLRNKFVPMLDGLASRRGQTPNQLFDWIVESDFIKNPTLSYLYSKNVIKGRWPEAEPVIAKDPYWKNMYSKEIIKGLRTPSESNFSDKI